MARTNTVQEKVVRGVEQCLRDMGFDPKSRLSEHDGLVFALDQTDQACVRIVLHVSDREAMPHDHGSANIEQVRSRLALASIRPSLATRARGRQLPPSATEACECPPAEVD